MKLSQISTDSILRKTLAVILVGVFLLTGTFGWAKEEELFLTGMGNNASSSRPADNNKLAPASRFSGQEFKTSLTVAAICKHVEHDGSLDDKSYLNDVLTRLDAGKNPNITVLPYEILIEIPNEGLAVRYFDPTKANVVTPYSDISKLQTKAIGPRLNRQIIHRVKALALTEVDEVAYMNEAFFRAYFTDYMDRKIDLKVPERSIYQDVDIETFLNNGRSKEGMVMPSISDMNLSLLQLSQAGVQPTKDFLYFMPLKENMVVDAASGKLAIRSALYVGPDRIFKVLRFAKPLPLDKVFYHGFDTNFSKMLENLGYSQISHCELTRDKRSSKEYCLKAGVATPAYIVLKDDMKPDLLEETVKTFVDSRKVAFGYVVKPVDESQGHGVKMFKPDEVEKMIFYAKRLLRNRKQILIEERIPSYPYYEDKRTRMDWNMRALAGWSDGRLFLSPETIEIRYKQFDGYPVNVSKGAGVKNFREFLVEMGYDDGKIARLFNRIRSDVEKNIKAMGVRYGFFGFDLILGEDEALYTIEINSGPVGGPRSLFDINLGDEKNQWVAGAVLYEFYNSLPEHKRDMLNRGIDKIDAASGDANVMGNLANILWGCGKARNDMCAIALAKKYSRKLIDDFPDIWIGHRIMSEILLQEGNLESAVEYSTKAGILKSGDGGFHQDLFLSSPAFGQVKVGVVSTDNLFQYGYEYDTSHKGLPVARVQELIKRQEGMRDCREMMNWPLEDIFDFLSLYQWRGHGSVESRVCNLLINRLDIESRSDMAGFLRKMLLLVDSVPYLPSLQDIVTDAVNSWRWSVARVIFMLPPEYAAKLIDAATGSLVDYRSKLFGILRDRHLVPEAYRENLDRIFDAYLDEILYAGDRNELRRIIDEIVVFDNISDYSGEFLDVVDNTGKMKRIRELMNNPYFPTFLKPSWNEKFLQPMDDWKREACERMRVSDAAAPKITAPAKGLFPNDASQSSHKIGSATAALRITNALYKSSFPDRRGMRKEDINIMITYRCPFNCDICLAKDARVEGGAKEMKKETFFSIIDQFKGFEKIHIVGTGEPLAYGKKKLFEEGLSEDFCEMVKYAAERTGEVRIVTNAYLIPADLNEAREFFRELNFPSNVVWLVSVDRSHEKEMARLMNGKSLLRLVETLERLSEEGVIKTAYNMRVASKADTEKELGYFGLRHRYGKPNIFIDGLIAQGNAADNNLGQPLRMDEMVGHAATLENFFYYIDPDGNVVPDHFAYMDSRQRKKAEDMHSSTIRLQLGNIKDDLLGNLIVDHHLFENLEIFLRNAHINIMWNFWVKAGSKFYSTDRTRKIIKAIIFYIDGNIGEAQKIIKNLQEEDGIPKTVLAKVTSNIFYYMFFNVSGIEPGAADSFMLDCFGNDYTHIYGEIFVPAMRSAFGILNLQKRVRLNYEKITNHYPIMPERWLEDTVSNIHCPVYETGEAGWHEKEQLENSGFTFKETDKQKAMQWFRKQHGLARAGFGLCPIGLLYDKKADKYYAIEGAPHSYIFFDTASSVKGQIEKIIEQGSGARIISNDDNNIIKLGRFAARLDRAGIKIDKERLDESCLRICPYYINDNETSQEREEWVFINSEVFASEKSESSLISAGEVISSLLQSLLDRISSGNKEKISIKRYFDDGYKQEIGREPINANRAAPKSAAPAEGVSPNDKPPDSADSGIKNNIRLLKKDTQLICVVGGIGAGKSSAADILKEKTGASLINVDQIGRDLQQKDEIIAQIASLFGSDILTASGQIDRGKLRNIYFRDPQKKQALQQIMRPYVIQEAYQKLILAFNSKAPLVIIEYFDIANSVFAEVADAVWYVDAPEALRIDRIVKSRNISPEIAGLVVEEQRPLIAAAKDKASVVIDNSNGPEALRAKIDQLVRSQLRIKPIDVLRVVGEENVGIHFPGVGSITPEMTKNARDLYNKYTGVRTLYDEASTYVSSESGMTCPVERLFLADYEKESAQLLPSSLSAFLYSLALYRALEDELGRPFSPRIFAGACAGTWAAAVVSKAISLRDMLYFIIHASRFYSETQHQVDLGYIKISGVTLDEVEGFLVPGQVELFSDFSPGTIILSVKQGGGLPDIENLAGGYREKLKEKRGVAIRVNYPPEFKSIHNTFLREMTEQRLKDIVSHIRISEPRFPILSSSRRQKVIFDAAKLKEELEAGEFLRPLYWRDALLNMADSGVKVFMIIGPGFNLARTNSRILPDMPLLNVNTPELMLEASDAIKTAHGKQRSSQNSETSNAAAPKSAAPAKVENQKRYIDKNKALFEKILVEERRDTLVRVPIEAIESVGADNIKDFLETFQKAPNGYVELYYMSGVGEVSENVYQKYGLQKKPLPKDFKRNRENTVTLFPAFKGKEVDQPAIVSRLGNLNMIPEDTILSPIGLQHDPAGLIRATILGLKMIDIARKINKGGVKGIDKDAINLEILHPLRDVCDAGDFSNINLTPDDIIGLAAGDINNIIAALNKLIKLLPIAPINAEELTQIYEHVKAVITAA